MKERTTRVALTFVPGRINVYLRFGHPSVEETIDRYRHMAAFASDAIFCRIRWQANAYGTTLWQLAVMQSHAPGSEAQYIVGVVPGARVLLQVEGPSSVQPVLRLIDAMEEQGIDPSDVSPHYWRVVQNRLAARFDVAPFTLDRYVAHLALRSIS